MATGSNLIEGVEDAIKYTLRKDAFENKEDVHDLLQFLIYEPVSSNKSSVLGSSLYFTGKEAYVKFLRSQGAIDVNYLLHKRVKFNRDAIREFQKRVPTPVTFKAERMYFTRTVVDRLNTITIATDHYVYKRTNTGIRFSDFLVIDATKLSSKDYVTLLSIIPKEVLDEAKDEHGNYINLSMVDDQTDRTLGVTIHGVKGRYHDGIVIPTQFMDTGRLILSRT